MQLHQLQRVHKNRRSPQVGRGGKRGKTSGRGGKGQTARAGHKARPEMRDIIKRIPKLRGRGKNIFQSFEKRAFPLNLEALEKAFAAGASVTPAVLVEMGLLEQRSGITPRIKILGQGTLTKKLVVSGCEVSVSAKVAIEAAGGSVELPKGYVAVKPAKVAKTKAPESAPKAIEGKSEARNPTRLPKPKSGDRGQESEKKAKPKKV